MIPRVIPRPVRTLVVGISWHNFACSGKLTIEVTAYYEIATGAAHPRNDTQFGSFVGKINNHLVFQALQGGGDSTATSDKVFAALINYWHHRSTTQ